MTMPEKMRPKWVLFTIAVELHSEEPVEAGEMRGYNWLARRLNPERRNGREVDLISFHTVRVTDSQLYHTNRRSGQSAPHRVCGYAVRLRGTEPGEAAPGWLVAVLDSRDDSGQVRFRGITRGRPAPLVGRP
jgi:hypothetical protein